MASLRKQRYEDARLRVMRLINENSELSSRQIAVKVGISHGSAYYILAALINKGFVKLENFKKNPSKKQYTYLLTPNGLQEKYQLTLRFIKRKKREFEDLREEITVLETEVNDISRSTTKTKKI